MHVMLASKSYNYYFTSECSFCLAGHFLVSVRDRHGAVWISTCHSDCCSRQGQQDILNTVYRDERELAKVSNIMNTKSSQGAVHLR